MSTGPAISNVLLYWTKWSELSKYFDLQISDAQVSGERIKRKNSKQPYHNGMTPLLKENRHCLYATAYSPEIFLIYLCLKEQLEFVGSRLPTFLWTAPSNDPGANEVTFATTERIDTSKCIDRFTNFIAN